MSRNQAHGTVLGRFVLCLFVFAWAGASAQPCLMAMDMAAGKAMAAEHMSHDSHHSSASQAADDHNCDHCPPRGHQASASCASGLNAECGAAPEVSADSRTTVKKLKDAPDAIALPTPPPRTLSVSATPPAAPAVHGQLKYPAGPSICIRNCVFLK